MKKKKRIGIFGAGQAGAMIMNWLPADNEMQFFIDNSVKKQGQYFCGYEIVAADIGIKANLDLIWIAVLNLEAEQAIKMQLIQLGFKGEVRTASEIKEIIDLRVSALRLIADSITKRNVSGYVAELGVFRGDFASEINRLFPERKLFLFDTFSGFDAADLKIESKVGGKSALMDFSDTSEELVGSRLEHPEQAVFVRGVFPKSLKSVSDSDSLRFAFVSLDPDLYEPVKKGLEYFFPRLSLGGVIMVHDYNSVQYPNVKKAVDEYCNSNGIVPIPLMDLHGSAVIVKQ